MAGSFESASLGRSTSLRKQSSVGLVSKLALVVALVALHGVASQEPEAVHAETLRTFDAAEARQGVAVDANYFYAIGNQVVGKYERASGALESRWEDTDLIHFDSGMVFEARLYAAHSNYPAWPMESTIEVLHLSPLGSATRHQLPGELGSLTWVDRNPETGRWWVGFGNYDKVQRGQNRPYGETRNTRVARLSADWEVDRLYTLPPALLDRLRPMSNSGGSWGPDGLLYLTGHDHGEIYAMCTPAKGQELLWVATVQSQAIEGQGIAWDRSRDDRTLWGILKRARQVVEMKVPELPASTKCAAATGPEQR